MISIGFLFLGGGCPAIWNSINASLHSFEGGATKMASSKTLVGSEPEREKTEASEDSGKPFKFTVVSVFCCVKHNNSLFRMVLKVAV